MWEKRSALNVVAAVAGLLLAGCGTVTGGGFIESAGDEDERATFGVDITCDENGYLVGSWTYHDRTPGQDLDPVHVKGKLPAGLLACDSLEPEPGGYAEIWSAYTTQGKSGNPAAGYAAFQFLDTNFTGNAELKQDQMVIRLVDANFDSWYHNGPHQLLGGNLTVTEFLSAS